MIMPVYSNIFAINYPYSIIGSKFNSMQSIISTTLCSITSSPSFPSTEMFCCFFSIRNSSNMVKREQYYCIQVIQNI